jgi:flagellar FliL protein
MADTSVDEPTGEGIDGEAPKRRFSGKKIVIFIVLPIVVIGGLFQSGMLDSLTGGGGGEEHAVEEEEHVEEEMHESIYFDMPDMLVNLNTGTGQPTYLKLSVSLEVGNAEQVAELEKVLPRIIDRFQVYLRELRAEDISGSAGVYRLKEELLARVNNAIAPREVRDVLFREMLVQ